MYYEIIKEMESLTKQQLILLALFVSFVTSIATGIVTVSLVDQAPPGITQTISRVVEKTIEKVVTEPSATQAAAVTAIKETIVVKADDLVIDAIEKNQKSIVRIREVTGDAEERSTAFAGLGLMVSREGRIVTDISVAYNRTTESGASIPESYTGTYPDGRVFPLNIVHAEQSAGIMFLEPLVQDRDKGTLSFTVPKFTAAPLKLGQAVVAIGGEETSVVSTGIISNFVERQIQKTDAIGVKVSEKSITAIRTDLRSSDLVLGSILLNLSG